MWDSWEKRGGLMGERSIFQKSVNLQYKMLVRAQSH